MVFNATFNNISNISWLSVLLMEETRVPGENPLNLENGYFNKYFKKCFCLFNFMI